MGLWLYVKDKEGRNVYLKRISSWERFGEFRVGWARHLGFDLNQMLGYDGFESWEGKPLRAFFDHNDNKGTLSPSEAAEILKQVQTDAPQLPEHALLFRRLVAACEVAVKEGTPIIFT